MRPLRFPGRFRWWIVAVLAVIFGFHSPFRNSNLRQMLPMPLAKDGSDNLFLAS
jgi:hypothetical protein